MNRISSPVEFVRDAELISVSETDGEFSLELKAPPNLIYFDGHFDDFPVLPGVCQLRWADEYAQRFLSLPQGSFCEDVLKLKFTSPIRPGQILSLVLSQKAHRVSFSFVSAGKKFSSGVLVYGNC